MTRAYDPAFYEQLTTSYRRLVGEPLVAEAHDAVWLYEKAPFAVLAHSGDEPCFIYANRAAQACFGYGWDEFIGMPSRLSAAEPQRDERQRLLETVSRDGFAKDYAGVRIAKSGNRFWIENGVVWNLLDSEGAVVGQAATFSSWRNV